MASREVASSGYNRDAPGVLYLASWPDYPIELGGSSYGLEKIGITSQTAKISRTNTWSRAGATSIATWAFEDGGVPPVLETTVLAYWGLLRDGIDHPSIPRKAYPVESGDGITETHLFADYLDEYDHATTLAFITMLLDPNVSINQLLDTMPLTDCWDRDDLMMEEGTDWGILASWAVASRRRLGFTTLEEALGVAARPEMTHRAEFIEEGESDEGPSAVDPVFETVRIVTRGNEWRVLIEEDGAPGWALLEH